MTRVTMPEAQERLTELLAAAEAGEGVEIEALSGRRFRLVPASAAEGVPLPARPFVACEEDRPVPIKSQFEKPLTLLDPDAEILDAFEP